MSPYRVRRWSALAFVASLALVAAACQPIAPIRPTDSPAASAAAPSGVSRSPNAGGSLADALHGAMDIAAIKADLERLQSIADAHDGNRAAGSPGHDASVELVASQLRAAGYDVQLQPVSVPAFRELAPSVLTIAASGAPALEDRHDFMAMLFSASGDVTAKVFALGFDPDAQPGDRNGTGCEAADWTNVPAGVIALVQPGHCFRLDVVRHAQDAGVLALVTAYPEAVHDRVLRPTLIDPDAVRIPALSVTRDVGLALAQAANDGSQVHVATSTFAEHRESMNVIGELLGGDPQHVLVVGGHLDSVVDGPGINDNGSGTMAVLEIARELAKLAASDATAKPAWTVRVGFWTGEEIGILGATAYLGNLDSTARDAIEAYLNFDMLASPNGVRLVYDPAGLTTPAESGVVAGLLEAALDADGLAWRTDPVGATDHIPFDQWGIPVGGLFSGANEFKTAGDATSFGGTAGALADSCYHLACDTADHVDTAWLEPLARAAAWVVGRLASGEVVLAPS